MDTFTSQTVAEIWWVSLLLFAAVTGVVAVLLTLIVRTAASILDTAGDIWTQGQLVANNTIQIPILLGLTVKVLVQIRSTAEEIAGATAQVQSHARSCPGCPECVMGGKPL